MQTVENCTVISYAGGYKITANEGYVIYDTRNDEEYRTYHYTFIVPASFDTSVLATVLIAEITSEAEIFGNGAKKATEQNQEIVEVVYTAETEKSESEEVENEN